MSGEEVLMRLESGKIEPVYLLLGESEFLVEEFWKKLLSKALPKRGGFNGERLQAKESRAGDVIERLATTPMFGGRRVILVEGVDGWTKEDKAAVESFLPKAPPSACLVMSASGKKGVEELAKAVESRGKVILFKEPGEKEAPRWLVQRAREQGKELDLRAAFVLVEMCGSDFQTLASELEKICAFVGDRNRIETSDVTEAASSGRAFSMFDLLDYVKARNPGKAVRALRSLILSGEAPLKILSSLAWQIRTLWQVRDGAGQGMSEAEMAKKIGAHPFVIKKAREQARSFSEAELYRILDTIGRLDVAMKSSGAAPEALLEEFLVYLCMERKRPAKARAN